MRTGAAMPATNTRKAPSPGPSSSSMACRRYDLSFTTALFAVHGESVALTQPAGATVAGSGLTQPCAVKSRCSALAAHLEVRRLLRLHLAGAGEACRRPRLRRRDLVEPRRRRAAEIVDADAGAGRPPSDSLALQRVRRRLLHVRRAAAQADRERTSDRASNVPARFGVPLPGLYGVKSVSQRRTPPAGRRREDAVDRELRVEQLRAVTRAARRARPARPAAAGRCSACTRRAPARRRPSGSRRAAARASGPRRSD